MTPNEIKLVNMDFGADIDGEAIIDTINSIAVSTGGPTASDPSFSTTKAQHKFNAAGVTPALYTVTIKVTTDDSPAQTFEAIGELLVEAVST